MDIGIDTGFLVELLRGNSACVQVWRAFVEGEDRGICSALTIFEVERLGLRGVIEQKAAESLLEAIPFVCQVIWIDNQEVLSLAAKLSHGLGIPTVDALILAGFARAKAEIIYTTDKHLESYKKKRIKVINVTSGL